jgi:murein DD-endopeptidase MepM/ murein hydrolase activator NlpD
MCAKVKYRFNARTLMFERIRENFWHRLGRVLSYVLIGVIFSVVSIYLSDYIFPSPGQRNLQRKLRSYETRWQLLSDKVELMEKAIQELEERDKWVYQTLFETNLPSFNVSARETEKIRLALLSDNAGQSKILEDLTFRISALMVRIQKQKEVLDEITRLSKNKEEMLQSVPAILPVDKNDLRRSVFSGFGWRIHPIYKTSEFHPGIDLTALQGTPVYATGNGIVERADNLAQGYGNHIVIDHGFGYKTLYAHLSRFACKPGQKVKRGQLIGYVGSTGLSTAPHLHYEVIHNGEKVNPVMFFHADMDTEQYLELIHKANQPSQSFD